jgi:hypothetical protein
MAGHLRNLLRRGLARFRWPLAGLTALLVVLACVLVIPQWLVSWELGASAHTLPGADKAKAINDVRATLLQGIGGAVLLLGAYFTYRQLQTGREQLEVARQQSQVTAEQAREQLAIAQQGQVTERFTRAVDQLGSERLDVRLGGIYALERVAHDSPQDRSTIGEVLTAYVRQRSPWPPSLPGQYREGWPLYLDGQPELRVRAPDVQAALTVLGRGPFPKTRDPQAPWAARLDLRLADLRRADLIGAHLEGAILREAHLEGAVLRGAHLEGARLHQVRLDEAFLQAAHLEGADLTDAHLPTAQLQGADLTGALLQGAHADARTSWPQGFNWRAAGVELTDRRADAQNGPES